MKPHLQCAEQQVSRSNLTKYCACHAERLTYLVLITYETSFTKARGNRCHDPTSPNTAPATKNDTARFKENLQKQVKRHFQCGDDPSMIRAWSDHDPTMKPSVRHPPRNRGYFSSSPRAFSIEKYNVSHPIFQTFTKYCACHEKWH